MLLIKNGRVIDPLSHLDQVMDLLIDEGKIIEMGHIEKDCETIDAKDMIVAPGLIDNHVHFRDPGLTYKEDIYTGSNAAKAGGFTTVVTMANTKPSVDCVEVLDELMEREKELDIHVLNTANVTLKMQGKELVDMEALKAHGAVGFTDDGIPIADINVMMEAMRRAKALDCPISLHEEDPALIGSAGINAGEIARQVGVKGASGLAEEVITARDCLLAKETGCRIDIQHISSGGTVDIVRFMKSQGADVWSEVTPQHFGYTEDLVLSQGALAKVNPPLRKEEDRLKIIEGLKDGTIDMIVTDHAPHSKEEKDKGILGGAPSGMIGLELSLAMGITHLVEKGHLSYMELLEKMTINPAKYYKLDAGYIAKDHIADIVIFDPKKQWVVTLDDFKGKSKNSPFVGEHLTGQVAYTICNGKIVYKKGS